MEDSSGVDAFDESASKEALTRTRRVVEWQGCIWFQLSANQLPGVTLFFNYPLHYALRKIAEAPKCQLWVHLIIKKHHFTRLNISFALSVSILVPSSVSGRVDAKQAKVKWRSPRHPGDLDPATGWEAAKQTRGRRWGSERRHIRGGIN